MDLDTLIRSVRGKVASRHGHNIVVTAMLADWLHTLPFEVEVIWPARWNVVKFLYFFSRYFPLDIIFSYIYIEVPDVKMCRISYFICSVTLLLSLGVSEAVIFIRIYALSRQSTLFRWWLIFQFCAVQITMYVLLGHLLVSFRWIPSPVPDYVACIPAAAEPIYATVCFGLLMANETLIVLVMLYIGYMRHRHTRSSLVKIFYRDGFIFFFVLVASSIVNIAMLTSLDPTNQTLFAIPQRVIHSLLASRMILHLRQESYVQEHGHSFDERYMSGSVVFAHMPMSFQGRRPSTSRTNASFFDLQDMSSKR